MLSSHNALRHRFIHNYIDNQLKLSHPDHLCCSTKPGVPFDTLTSFTNRLETENDPSTITVTEDPGDQFLAYWYLPLLPHQVQTYLQDPAVSAHLGTI